MYQPLPQILLCPVRPDPGDAPAAFHAPLACSLSPLGVNGGRGMCSPRAVSSVPRAEPLRWHRPLLPLGARSCLGCFHPERGHAGAPLGGFYQFSGLLLKLTGSDTSALPRSQPSKKASCLALPLESGIWGEREPAGSPPSPALGNGKDAAAFPSASLWGLSD